MNESFEQGDSLGLTQERFGFTMFMSVCVHVMLILGVGFTIAPDRAPSTSMAVTLAQYRSTEAPEDADFLAQANQQGSGSEEDTLAPASPFESRFNADEIREVNDFLQERPTTPVREASDRVIASSKPAAEALPPEEETPVDPSDPVALNSMTPTELNNTVASLQAQLDLHRQEYAKRPRRYTISSASTREDRDALYLDNWRKRIEAIGNLNYPAQASVQGIYGMLRVMVALNPDGTVNDIRILRSSGERVLDEAAIRIVQLAAPFEPFPPEMRANVDVLEIIRTWQFHRGDTFSSF
jgi:protein TonB